MFDEIFETRHKDYKLKRFLYCEKGLEVYSGMHVYEGKSVIIKFESNALRSPLLCYEKKMMQATQKISKLIRQSSETGSIYRQW